MNKNERVIEMNYLWDKSIHSGFIFDTVDFSIVTNVLIPANTVGAFIWVFFSGYFASFLCENFILSFEAVFSKPNQTKPINSRRFPCNDKI